MSPSLRIAGLFAGIGGIELGFQRGLGDDSQTATEMLCESWAPAQQVLAQRFPDVPLHPDVRDLRSIPPDVDLLAAGFPCTDLSQAGRTAGISGAQSSLVGHVFEAIRIGAARHRSLPWLLIENVPNMLALDRGRAMAYVVRELESLGYRWAYRVVDSRACGVPQRRRRVLLLASGREDPRPVLFAEDAGPRGDEEYASDAFGFYWTEGRGGLGWARDAVPTLKGGSTIGIPSPPAIWVPDAAPGRRILTPSMEDAEEMQGFPRGWTTAAEGRRFGRGSRWKLVGNAVTVDVAAWLAARIVHPGVYDSSSATAWSGNGSWPTAAWGEAGSVRRVDVTEHPVAFPYQHLLDVVNHDEARPLSHRGTAGFLKRLEQGNLGRHPGFRPAVAEHRTRTCPATQQLTLGPESARCPAS